MSPNRAPSSICLARSAVPCAHIVACAIPFSQRHADYFLTVAFAN